MGEVLHNGIRLPDEWPPRCMDPHSKDPMPVPYLEQPPEIIPVDLGRQLFVDDFLIGATSLQRVFHHPVKHRCNPIFEPKTLQELAFPSVGFLKGGVFYNPAQKRFEMFYHSGELHQRALHMATSRDMVDWERPDVGKGAGNQFLPPGGWTGTPERTTAGTAFAVWLDLETENAQERYKMLSYWGHYRTNRPPGGMTHSLHTSPDGIHWSDAVLAGKAADAQSLFFNPFRQVWVYSIKRRIERDQEALRARWYVESPSFMEGGNWDDAVYWTCADRLDRPEPKAGYPAYPFPGDTCQLYSLHGTPYESIMLGMHEIHRGPSNQVCQDGRFPKLTDLELGFSRDGFHWHRPDRSGFIRCSRGDRDWDRGYLHSPASICVIHDDRLIFPYNGFSGRDPDGANPGIYRGGAIGIATLRRDGFASMRAGREEGTLLTRPVTFSGGYLFVNVDNPGGSLAVEVCSDQGEPLPGYAKSDCISIAADSTKTMVTWRDRRALWPCVHRPLRLRFHLTGGDLYSFWTSRSESGASGGYVAGGGSQFSGNRDV